MSRPGLHHDHLRTACAIEAVIAAHPLIAA
jgi:hypothetical protein